MSEPEEQTPRRRDSDRLKAEISSRNSTVAAISTILLFAWWVGGQAAKEEIIATRELALENGTLIGGVISDISDMRGDVKELLKITRAKSE